jgi:hypothetical protein
MVRHPYTIFYRVKAEQGFIEVLRVIYSPRITDLGTVPDK